MFIKWWWRLFGWKEENYVKEEQDRGNNFHLTGIYTLRQRPETRHDNLMYEYERLYVKTSDIDTSHSIFVHQTFPSDPDR